MTRRSPNEGALFQRKSDGLWVASVEIPTFDGRRRRVRKYAKTKSAAAAKLRALRAECHTEAQLVGATSDIAGWLSTWLETVKKPQVAPTTYQFYEEAVRLHIVPTIGAVRLDRLVPQHVRHMLETIQTTRNKQRAHLVLKMALDTAVSDGMISRNAAKLVPKPRHVPQPSTAFDVGPARQLIASALDIDRRPGAPQLATRWIMGLITGARRGELLGLEWQRVNFDNAEANIEWQLQQLTKIHGCNPAGSCGRQRASYCPQSRWDFQPHFEYRECYKSLAWTRPKTRAGKRIVPLEWPLLPMLQSHQECTAAQPNPHGLVWHHLDGRPISPREDHDLWHALLAHAGLQRVKLHTLRHTAATLLHRSNVSEEVRMQIMGQSSHVAHQGYVHVERVQERVALRELGQKLHPSARAETL